MAVANGYGKVVTSGSVFMYDTGDTVNSYRGEPTTNLWDTMLNTQSLRSHTKHFWDGKQWIVDATYTHPGVDGPKGVYLGLVFKHVSGAFNSTWSGTSYGYMLRDIACTSGATMTQSVWIYLSENCNLDGVPSVIEQESGGESSVAGYASQYDLNNKGTWQVIAKKAISDGQVRFIPLYPRKNGTTVGEFTGFLMWALPQVTYGNRVVQPIQPGTIRSATQGLLPIVGNSTIDLSNVSFDSNAQMVFDGTDDFISLPSTLTSSFNPTEFTVEVIVNYESFGVVNSSRPYISNWNTWSPGSQKGFILRSYGTSQSPSFWWCDGINYTSITATTQMSTNQYYHILATYSSSGVKLYVNGIVEATSTSLLTGVVFESTTRIGFGTINTGYFDGQIPVAKIYNRALTSTEVKQNYNKYKSRFNLS